MVKALYAFSGDPITYGHLNIITRASKIFDEVLVGIGVNPTKNYMFSLEERSNFAKESTRYLPNVSVDSFRGMLTDYAFEQRVDVVIKGVRNSADFDYEEVLHQVGKSQNVGIETLAFFADPRYNHISSSMVKAVQQEHGLIHDYVPPMVKEALEKKISNQTIIGITGNIASGKSYTANKLVELGERKGVQIHNIEMDHIGHEILSNLTEPAYQQTREDIRILFGEETLKGNTIDRKVLGEIVFGNESRLNQLNSIMRRPMEVRLRRELYGKQGIILVNGATIIEAGMLPWVNYNLIMVGAEPEVQKTRLKERGLTEEQIDRRLNSQMTNSEKMMEFMKKSDKPAKLILHQDQTIEELYNRIEESYGTKIC